MSSKYLPDISHYHPVSSWSAVKNNCVALISKATEGVSFIDGTLETFISGCENNGIPYWLYAFLNKGYEAAQVDHLIDVCASKVGRNFVGYALDIESNNEPEDINDAIHELERYTDKYLIYTNYNDYEKYKSIIESRASTCGWWEARYGLNDGTYRGADYPCHEGVDLHQYTSVGEVLGIGGNCDLNYVTCANGKTIEWFGNRDTETTGDVTVTTTTVKDGKQGEYVKGCQILLNGWGYSCGSVDGICGTKTVSAIKSFQKAKSLSVDGICGKNTWNRLVNG